ncbi:MBL fold metallo-hydrolase [Candidatus Kaiserbacteria bacterium]|nr:MBL fold metallo-hydrolase [Candidatus Kaiserbacteria bacterium]
MSLRLKFYGGAGKVTGSNFLLESSQSKILIDCGIEQGADIAVEEVYGPFPYDVSSIGALIVTHAHLDHVGRIPKLVKEGFRGRIHMTPPTRDLAELILRDSASILREEARRLGREPLYEEQDVDSALMLIEPLEYHTEKEVAPGLSAYLRDSGHILGSASVRIQSEENISVAFTGDIGNSPSPLLPDFEPVPDADVLVMESVYGNRAHPPQQRRAEILVEALKRAISRGGAILIPAFSLERTQLMLYELSNFFTEDSLPQIPVFLDSPLAIRVTDVYEKWGPTYFKPEAEDEMKREGSIFNFPFLTKTLSREESAAIEKVAGPKIVIAGAGMSHGGRIGRWEARYLPDPKTTLFTVGYQAPGSPGRRIAEGASSVRIAGTDVPIRAKVEVLEGWSAHADREGLLEFAQKSLEGGRVKTIFTALGEPAAERFLAQRIHDYLGARAIVPEFGQTWEIAKDSVNRI